MPEAIALLHAYSYEPAQLRRDVFCVLNATCAEVCQGRRILVKPNLLMAHPLACASPGVVAAACEWLLGRGAKPVVADSPAFGTCKHVSNAIGLTAALKPLGIVPRNFHSHASITLNVEGSPKISVAREALECDSILSIARVKAHSQMRLTLSVKNCFGCVPGARKAIAHVRFGGSVEYFAECLADLWRQLPPAAGLLDGIEAMSRTGPRNGDPYPLHLLASSPSAPLLDLAAMKILGVDPATVPLAAALEKIGFNHDAVFTLEKPENFSAPGFEVPQTLKDVSFSPLVLAKSILKRLYMSWKG